MPVDRPRILQGETNVLVDLTELNDKITALTSTLDTANGAISTLNSTLSGVAAALDAILG